MKVFNKLILLIFCFNVEANAFLFINQNVKINNYFSTIYFQQETNNESLILLFLGFIIASALFSFFSFFILRKLLYLIFSLHICSFFIYFYFFTDIELINNFYVQILAKYNISFMIITFIFFILEFLEFKNKNRKIYNIFLFLIFISLIISLIRVPFFLYILLVFLMLIVIIIEFFRSNKNLILILFILGILMFLSMILINTLSIHTKNLINYNYVNLMIFFVLIELILFSISLILIYKKTKDENSVLKNIHKKRVFISSMGEIYSNILHDIKQPINNINLIKLDLEIKMLQKKEIDIFYLEYLKKELNQQIEHCNNTIEVFYKTYFDFFNKNDQPLYETISLMEIISQIKNITLPELEAKDIKLIINNYLNIINDIKAGYELTNVLINIINNAKNILIHRKIENPKIELNIYTKNKFLYFDLIDNGKGINFVPIEKVFEPYVTSNNKNFGIGLYFSKMIIEHFLEGKITVSNDKLGAKFSVIIPL